MAGTVTAKIKLLYLIDIFSKKTDEDNVLSAVELCKSLAQYGISAERKSIYKDIEILRQYGYDIIHTRNPNAGYFLANRSFELAEIRLLIDAIQAANFISSKKTKSLISKIEAFISNSQAMKLRQQVYVDKRPKCKNEEIYYSIDLINTAILSEMQIGFSYAKRIITNNNTAEYDEKYFIVNPYAMIWANDHYYLVCNNPKYNNLMHTRIDRMKKVEVLDKQARHFSEVSDYKTSFDSADYTNKIFNMYSGSPEPVIIICQNDMIDLIIDRFGDNISILRVDDNHFKSTINATITDGLVSWLMQFGAAIHVESPEILRAMLKEKAEDILNCYN